MKFLRLALFCQAFFLLQADPEPFWLHHPSRIEFDQKISNLGYSVPISAQSTGRTDILTSVTNVKKRVELKLKHWIPGNPDVKLQGKKFVMNFHRNQIDATKDEVEVKRTLKF